MPQAGRVKVAGLETEESQRFVLNTLAWRRRLPLTRSRSRVSVMLAIPFTTDVLVRGRQRRRAGDLAARPGEIWCCSRCRCRRGHAACVRRGDVEAAAAAGRRDYLRSLRPSAAEGCSNCCAAGERRHCGGKAPRSPIPCSWAAWWWLPGRNRSHPARAGDRAASVGRGRRFEARFDAACGHADSPG